MRLTDGNIGAGRMAEQSLDRPSGPAQFAFDLTGQHCMATGDSIIRRHISLSLKLALRHGPVLAAIWAAGFLASKILLRVSVEIGLESRLLGLVTLSTVLLVQLLVFVGSFTLLRDASPPDAAPPSDATETSGAMPWAAVLVVALIPFYGYYAGWGLMGNTLREYAQLLIETEMSRTDFSTAAQARSAFDVGQTYWVVCAVALVWLMRRLAKRQQTASAAAIWPMIVVVCEATWAALGLYVISGWISGIAAWLAALPVSGAVFSAIAGPAYAETSAIALRPVDWPPLFEPWPFVTQLFWYALLPLVWFNLGAIVHGHNPNEIAERTRVAGAGAIRRWQSLSKPVRDFLGHFWMGTLKRWHAVANGVMLAGSAGLRLMLSVLVLWRLVDWLGNWAWIGAAHLIGPHDRLVWGLLEQPLDALFGPPGAPPGGLLVSPLQFCVLAAGLRLAGARARSEAAATA